MAATERKIDIRLNDADGQQVHVKRGLAHLVLSTRKHTNGGIVSAAHVEWANDGFRTMVLWGDFSMTVKTQHGRATQKAIDTQHAEAFTPEKVAEVTDKALTFYAAKRPPVVA